MRKTCRVTVVIAVIASVQMLAQQALTLRDLAAQSGGEPVVRGVLRDPPRVSLEELSKRAVVVVVGRLVAVRSYLAERDYEVHTDYNVVPSQVIVDRAPGQSRPGLPPSITVTVVGGSTTVGGTRVEFPAYHYRPFNPNATYLLFLEAPPTEATVATTERRFVPIGESAGIFEMTGDNHVKTMMRGGPPTHEIESLLVPDLTSRVQSLAGR